MPKGGIRPRSSDGSLDHLLKPKWKQGRTRTIRVPKVLAQQLLSIAHHLDDGGTIDLTQDNNTAHHPYPDDWTPDKQLNLEVERDSEALRRSADRFLASLKVGRQAPEYKRTKAVLDRFLAFCRGTSQNDQNNKGQHEK